MITLSSIHELEHAKAALEKVNKKYPALYENLLDMINLTRAFHFKYHYMSCMIMGENPGTSTPEFVYGSVLRLYKRELQKLMDNEDFHIIKQTFTEFQSIGYANLCLLALGREPEALVGPSFVK